jgi:type II secretory pathway pseudopilin PulG
MKLPTNSSRARAAGFTLVEMLTVVAICLLLVAVIVATQLFAARIYTFAATKLTAVQASTKGMNAMRDQIRQSSQVDVGIYNTTANTFSLIGNGSNQIGNALQVMLMNPGISNVGTIFFMNPSKSNICSVVISNGAVLPATMRKNIVMYITNYYVFDAEDSFTNILKTYQNNRVIHIVCQFCQWEYPLASAGNGAMYDYFQMQTRVARRVMDY